MTGSVRETARVTGVPRSTVSRWVRGKAGVELRQAADGLRAKVDILVGWAWVEWLRVPNPPSPLEVQTRMRLLREAIMAEELHRVRSLRRLRGVQSNAARAAGPR